MSLRLRRCPVCKTKFEPARELQKCCDDPDCAITLGRQLREKAERIADRKKRYELKTMGQLRADVQAVVNLYVRLRDEHLPCISCDRYDVRQWHAGHLKTRGAHPELAFHEWNINKQCSQCNDHLSGNVEAHREGIRKRYGQERLDWLDGPHEPQNLTREELIRLRQFYCDKIRELREKRSHKSY